MRSATSNTWNPLVFAYFASDGKKGGATVGARSPLTITAERVTLGE
jgi:hypothetical protein